MKISVLVDIHANGDITIHKSKVVIGKSTNADVAGQADTGYAQKYLETGSHIDLYA